MFDHDIASVVGRARNLIAVNDVTIRDRMNVIERLAMHVAVHRANIHPFVKARIDRFAIQLSWIAHKAVLTALPRIRNRAMQVSFDDLIEVGTVSAEQGGVIGWQTKFYQLIFLRMDRIRTQKQQCQYLEQTIYHLSHYP
jgi:hypothetical protein